MRETSLAAKSVEKQMFSLANFHSKHNLLRLLFLTSQRASDSTSFLSQPKSIVQSKKIAPQTAPSKSTPSSLQSESFQMSVFNSSIQVTAAKQNKLDKRRQSNLCNEVSIEIKTN